MSCLYRRGIARGDLRRNLHRCIKLLVALLAVSSIVLGVEEISASPVSLATDVSIGEFFFNPDPVTIIVGDTVQWDNNGAISHTTTANGGAWNSGLLAPGGSFSQPFNSPGTFEYLCTVPGHAALGMVGTINVVAGIEVDLEVTKTESIDPVVAGSGQGNLTHIVTVTNNGPSDATGVTLSEVLTLPNGVIIDSITPSVGTTFDDQTKIWTVGDMASGDSETLTVVLTVDATALAGVVSDTAAVESVVETDKNKANNSVSEDTSIVRVICGDVHPAGGGDGDDDVLDALRKLKIAVGLVVPTARELIAGDVHPDNDPDPDGDGDIDVLDALRDLKASVGLVVITSCGGPR